MARHSKAHPGFKSVSRGIAKRQGISQKRANARRGLFRAWLGLWSFDGKVTGDDNAEHDHGH